MKIPSFRLERYFASYEFDVPYLLCSSDCESFSVGELLAQDFETTDAFHDLWLGYTETNGHPLIRQEIAKLYQNITPDQILVHSGAEEAIFNFMNAILSPGDHIIVHWPGYQSLFEIAHSIGCEVTKWEVREEEGWEHKLDFLRDNLRPNTRVVVLNYPHNPTGYNPSRATWEAIDQLSQEHGFIVFSDEVYRFLEYHDEDRLPSFCEANANAVSLGAMSKSFGLAGLRIGWIATKNAGVFQKMAQFKDYTTICNSAPSEFLATIALRSKDWIIHRNLQIILKNLTILNQFFAHHSDVFNWQPPKAGPIAFPSLANGGNVEMFCQRLVTEAGVLLLPGTVYEKTFAQNFRIGFGRKNLPECIEKLDEFLFKRGASF